MQTKDWFHEWLEHYVKPASKQKTYVLYCELTAQHILPKFGEMELECITPLALQRYISELMEHGISERETGCLQVLLMRSSP